MRMRFLLLVLLAGCSTVVEPEPQLVEVHDTTAHACPAGKAFRGWITVRFTQHMKDGSTVVRVSTSPLCESVG